MRLSPCSDSGTKYEVVVKSWCPLICYSGFASRSRSVEVDRDRVPPSLILDARVDHNGGIFSSSDTAAAAFWGGGKTW